MTVQTPDARPLQSGSVSAFANRRFCRSALGGLRSEKADRSGVRRLPVRRALNFLAITALPFIFVREVGLPGYAPGNAFSVKSAVEIAAIACMPLLMTRFGLRSSLTVTAALAVGAILFLESVQAFGQMLIGAVLEGLYCGLFSTLAIGWVQPLAPGRTAQATAVYWNATMTASVLAGPAAGLIAQETDFRAAILGGAGFALLALVIISVGGRHRAMPAAKAA